MERAQIHPRLRGLEVTMEEISYDERGEELFWILAKGFVDLVPGAVVTPTKYAQVRILSYGTHSNK